MQVDLDILVLEVSTLNQQTRHLDEGSGRGHAIGEAVEWVFDVGSPEETLSETCNCVVRVHVEGPQDVEDQVHRDIVLLHLRHGLE